MNIPAQLEPRVHKQHRERKKLLPAIVAIRRSHPTIAATSFHPLIYIRKRRNASFPAPTTPLSIDTNSIKKKRRRRRRGSNFSSPTTMKLEIGAGGEGVGVTCERFNSLSIYLFILHVSFIYTFFHFQKIIVI